MRGRAAGFANSALGNGALGADTEGNGNAASGFQALAFNTTGNLNTASGEDAGYTHTTANNNIDVGYNAGNGTFGESNTIRIGVQGTQNQTFLAGVLGTNVGPSPPVLVNEVGQLGVNTSSRRFKSDIHPLRAPLGGLMRLNPVSFRYKPHDVDGPNPTEFGLLAEQVAKVYPNLLVDRGGKPYTVLYQQLPALELAELQHEHAVLGRQQTRNRSQAGHIRSQRARLRYQGRQIASLRRAVVRLSQRN